MTIDQLITTLTRLREKTGGDAPVIVDGYEDGYQDIREVEAADVVDLRNPNFEWTSWWSGYYEKISEYCDGTDYEPLPAVVIHR